MAETTYTYSLASDFPDGAINSTKLVAEIAASSIVTALERIDTVGDVVDIIFKDALSAGDKTTLDNDATGPSGGLIAAHDSTITSIPDIVEINPRTGGSKMDIDGVAVSAAADEWNHADYLMPEDLHVQGVHAQWQNTHLGDYAWIVVLHPSSEGAPAAEAASGQAVVDMGPALAPYYDPAAGAKYMEFWDETGGTPVLKEVRKIASRSGDEITLDSNLAETHPVTETVRARFDGFSPVRGTHGIEGGFCLLNAGEMLLRNEIGITNIIPANMLLCVRMKTTSTAGTRELAVSFIFRKPEA
jgi:hypothetical protein